jgi:DNA-3-methyladenine glycosylase II
MTDAKKIIDHFKKVDPIIYQHIKVFNYSNWIKPALPNTYFQRLCREIIGQQLSDKSSAPIIKRFRKLFGSKKITPSRVLGQSDTSLREVGMTWAKASYVKNIARAFLENKLLTRLNELKDNQVITELTKIKGIGPWTAEMFLIFTLGREDVFSHGDLGLKRGLEKLYNLKNPSRIKIESITTRWMPYRSYGSIALWRSLDLDK